MAERVAFSSQSFGDFIHPCFNFVTLFNRKKNVVNTGEANKTCIIERKKKQKLAIPMMSFQQKQPGF